MQLTDDEQARVEEAVAKLPRTFAYLEGDAVPLGPDLLISSGFDLENNRSTAILFNDAGEILYAFNHVELHSLKNTGRSLLQCRSQPPSTSVDASGLLIGCMS
jgi:hypothetical protein